MEQLVAKYQLSKTAIDSLGILLDKYKDLQKLDPIMELVSQESLIKRFEYSIDTLWKYLKLYLQKKHGIEQKSPKTVFKEFLRLGLLTEKETALALDMVDDRNETSHTYNKETAQEIVTDIPQYYRLMNDIIEKIKPPLQP